MAPKGLQAQGAMYKAMQEGCVLCVCVGGGGEGVCVGCGTYHGHRPSEVPVAADGVGRQGDGGGG
jgi:hypothetical protein